MVRNATMSIGALGLVDGTVILRWSAPLNDLDPDEFDVPLQGLAIASDMLEKELTGGRSVLTNIRVGASYHRRSCLSIPTGR
jgi:hypothetical protein